MSISDRYQDYQEKDKKDEKHTNNIDWDEAKKKILAAHEQVTKELEEEKKLMEEKKTAEEKKDMDGLIMDEAEPNLYTKESKAKKIFGFVKEHPFESALVALGTATAVYAGYACVKDLIDISKKPTSGRYPYNEDIPKLEKSLNDFHKDLAEKGFVVELGADETYFDYQIDPVTGLQSTFILEPGATVQAELTPETLQNILDNISMHYSQYLNKIDNL